MIAIKQLGEIFNASPNVEPNMTAAEQNRASCDSARRVPKRQGKSGTVMVCILAKGSGDCASPAYHDHPPHRLLRNLSDTTEDFSRSRARLSAAWGRFAAGEARLQTAPRVRKQSLSGDANQLDAWYQPDW